MQREERARARNAGNRNKKKNCRAKFYASTFALKMECAKFVRVGIKVHSICCCCCHRRYTSIICIVCAYFNGAFLHLRSLSQPRSITKWIVRSCSSVSNLKLNLFIILIAFMPWLCIWANSVVSASN